MKKSRKRLLISSIAMLLVAMLALGTATFAWFTQNTTATASGISVRTSKTSSLLISDDTQEYASSFTYQDVQPVMFPSSSIDGSHWFYTYATKSDNFGSGSNTISAIPNSPATGLSGNGYNNKGSVYYNGTSLALRTGEGTDDHAYYATKSSRQVLDSSVSSNNMFIGSQLGGDQPVVTMSKQSGNYRYGRVRVNLGIEGEDAEARLAFVGGKFEMKLRFSMAEAAGS